MEGVLCVDYFTLTDKPYLITGSADHTAKVWDYQTKRCLQTLEGHTDVVTAVCFHPVIPIIITVSKDATAGMPPRLGNACHICSVTSID